jgi:hypothetical protein
MAMEGLLALVVAATIAGNPVAATVPAKSPEPDSAIITTLAVQTAMQQARDELLRNNPRNAVKVLEEQLARINGNPVYLALLRDAYRAYVKQLRLSNQEALARTYQARLQILEPPSADDVPRCAVVSPQTPGNKVSAPRVASAMNPSVVRGKRDDADPFEPIRQAPARLAVRDLLEQAEQKFKANQFLEADNLFNQAHEADAKSTEQSRDRWGYCKLHHVVDQLNTQSTAFPEMENEVKSALNLHPSQPIDAYGHKLLAEIDHRKQPRSATVEPQWTVRDLGRTPEGWSVAESMNFRIYHNGPPDQVQRTAQVAEQTRWEMQRKWFGAHGPAWNPKCEIYLHATAQDYSRATGVPAGSPGHSSFQLDGGHLLGRRIDLHCDDPGMLIGVLPHEATHVVLAGNFGERPVPRWADEGMAVLTEPRDKIDRHLRNLPQHRDNHQLFPLQQLVQMESYPDPRYVGAFYAESVSLVEFLSKERGPQVFTQFVRDGMHEGYDVSLRRHYGYSTFDELERRWRAFAFSGSSQPARVTASKR